MASLEPPPLRSLERLAIHPALIVGVTCAGAFIGQLDASIVQLALPRLAEAFDVRVDAVRWVAIAYLLAFAASLAVSGRVSEMMGRKLPYLLGFALFTVASLLCGWAETLEQLVALRALQGVGGGLLGANSMTILVTAVPQEKRPHAIGWFTTAQAVGVSTGPIVGGFLLELLGWRWIFWAAVPFGVLAFVMGWLVLPRSRDEDVKRDETFDLAGAVLLVPAVGLGVLALTQVSVWPLASPSMLACAAASVLFLVLFLRRERKTRWPVVDIELFRSRDFSAGFVGVVMGYALLYGMLFLMSFAFVKGLDNRAHVAGLKLATIPILLGLVAPLAARLGGRFGARRVGIAGMALCLAAILALVAIAFGPDRLLVRLAALAVFGAGLGLFLAPNSHATIDAAPKGHASSAGGLVNLGRVLGSCIGVSAASSTLSWRLGLSGSADLMGPAFVEAVAGSLFVLAAFALVAITASLMARKLPAA
ncbi:MAG: major facilitator superfamily protein [Rhodospirillaceae bacterium]|nr:MAG: major facilitator superfamily protein [Rhodospirillaceae bacterium]